MGLQQFPKFWKAQENLMHINMIIITLIRAANILKAVEPEPCGFPTSWNQNPRVFNWLAELCGFEMLAAHRKQYKEAGDIRALQISNPGGWDLAKWLERLAVNGKVATVLGSIPASSDSVESEGRQMRQCWITYIKIKNPKNKEAGDIRAQQNSNPACPAERRKIVICSKLSTVDSLLEQLANYLKF
jgi:hypothetical protein